MGEYKIFKCQSLQECEERANVEAENPEDPKEILFIRFPKNHYDLQREPYFVVMRRSQGMGQGGNN
jgi:hypothetical protein